VEASIMQFNSSVLGLDFTTYIRELCMSSKKVVQRS